MENEDLKELNNISKGLRMAKKRIDNILNKYRKQETVDSDECKGVEK